MKWVEEYEAKLKSATPGPWEYVHENGGVIQVVEGCGEVAKGAGDSWAYLQIDNADAQFIASSPEMVAKLIAALVEAERVVTCVIGDLEETHLDNVYVRSAYEQLGNLRQQLQSGEVTKEDV